VPRNKFNQVSGISNFVRNIGGGIGISLLNNFIARQGQVHRNALVAHTNHAGPFFERQFQGMMQNFIAVGSSRVEASHRALAQLSAQVDVQSNVLSFASSFWVLACWFYSWFRFHSSCAAPARQKPRKPQRCIKARTTCSNSRHLLSKRAEREGRRCSTLLIGGKMDAAPMASRAQHEPELLGQTGPLFITAIILDV